MKIIKLSSETLNKNISEIIEFLRAESTQPCALNINNVNLEDAQKLNVVLQELVSQRIIIHTFQLEDQLPLPILEAILNALKDHVYLQHLICEAPAYLDNAEDVIHLFSKFLSIRAVDSLTLMNFDKCKFSPLANALKENCYLRELIIDIEQESGCMTVMQDIFKALIPTEAYKNTNLKSLKLRGIRFDIWDKNKADQLNETYESLNSLLLSNEFLETLALDNCHLTCEDISGIKESLGKNRSLNHLSLSGNIFDDSDILILVHHLPQRLERLSLNNLNYAEDDFDDNPNQPFVAGLLYLLDHLKENKIPLHIDYMGNLDLNMVNFQPLMLLRKSLLSHVKSQIISELHLEELKNIVTLNAEFVHESARLELNHCAQMHTFFGAAHKQYIDTQMDKQNQASRKHLLEGGEESVNKKRF